MIKKNSHSECFLLVALFTILSVVMLLIPLSVDDTYYVYREFNGPIDILKYAAGYGNGRIIGNFMGVVLSKNRIISAFVRAGAITYIIYCVSRLSCINNKYSGQENGKQYGLLITLLSSLVVLGIGSFTFAECFAWISAFCNYTLPMCIFLPCIIFVMRRDIDNVNTFIWFSVFIAAVAEQLFSEQNTLVCLYFSGIVFLIALIKRSRLLLKKITPMLAGNILGAAIMLYARMFLASDNGVVDTKSYQSIHIFDLKDLIHNAFVNTGHIFTYLIFNLVLICLFAFEGLVIIKDKKRFRFKLIRIFFYVFPVLALITIILYEKKTTLGILPVMASFVIFVFLIVYVVFLINDKTLRNNFLLSLGFSVLTLVHLLFVDPINSRLSFCFYIFAALSAMQLFGYIVSLVGESKTKHINRALLALLCVLLVFLLSVYASVYVTNKKLDEYCRYQVSQNVSEIDVCPLTDTKYYHHSSVEDRLGYVYYNNTPKDIQFNVISRKTWLKERYNDGAYKNN
ncbi:MAG: hypothetical protein IJ168_11000 [Eubacterium sp.]|nr:hypothetical protein [Eubacterium sp.]